MQSCSGNIKISGIVSAVPINQVDNLDYIEKIESRRIKKQILLTGINKRRVCINGQTATDLATVAADDLLNRLKWDRKDIDVVIYVTQSPELSRPSTAFIIQERLNIGINCLVFDVNLGCSGFIGGLEIMAGLLSTTKGKGLLLVGESHALEGGDINTSSLLVGDAASAIAIEYDLSSEMIFRHYSDGSRSDYIYKPFNKPGYMDGNAVLLFGLNDVVDSVVQFKTENNLTEENVDYYVFHQAQKMIIDGIAKGVNISEGKVLISCDDYGNTSSASIPLTLCVSKQNKPIRQESNFIMCGFGIGLSWGMAYISIDFNVIFPLIETDKVYDDREKFGI